MGYFDQAQLSQDDDFFKRVAACGAVEGTDGTQPVEWAGEVIWFIAAAPGFGDAYASAILNEVPNPGRDPSVISDAQILSAVQALPAAP